MFKDLWGQLPTDVKLQFETSARTIEKKRGEFIYQQGDQPQGLYFIESGLVGLVLIGLNSGKEHLLRFFRTGQFFGHRALFSKEGYHGTTVALESTRLLLVPKEAVLSALNRHPQLYSALVVVLAKELRRCEEQHVMILENQILARIAQALVYLKDLTPEHNWTRQEIANFCASTTSTVIKAMAELENLKLIKQTGRQIEILNRDGLINLQDHGLSV
jgi:CRP-like cAMP-binding protein